MTQAGTLLTNPACGCLVVPTPSLLLSFVSFEVSLPKLRLLFEHRHNVHFNGMLTSKAAFLQTVAVWSRERHCCEAGWWAVRLLSRAGSIAGYRQQKNSAIFLPGKQTHTKEASGKPAHEKAPNPLSWRFPSSPSQNS